MGQLEFNFDNNKNLTVEEEKKFMVFEKEFKETKIYLPVVGNDEKELRLDLDDIGLDSGEFIGSRYVYNKEKMVIAKCENNVRIGGAGSSHERECYLSVYNTAYLGNSKSQNPHSNYWFSVKGEMNFVFLKPTVTDFTKVPSEKDFDMELTKAVYYQAWAYMSKYCKKFYKYVG